MQSGLELFSGKHRFRQIKEDRKAEFNHCCAYCGKHSRFLTIDHVLPSAMGGTNDSKNLLPACTKCNGLKANKLLEQWYNDSNPRYSSERWALIQKAISL